MNENQQPLVRNKSIDSLRFIASISIVFLHYSNFEGGIQLFVKEVSRFSVPFFFALSGFLLSEKLQKQNSPKIYITFIKRIIGLSIIWNLIYGVFRIFIEYSRIDDFSFIDADYIYVLMTDVIFGRTSFHLWFFTSLYLTVFVYFLFGVRNIYLLLVFATVLYIYGVLGGGYSASPIGITVSFNTRNYIFLSSLPFFLGAVISLKKIRIGIKESMILFLIGFLLHLLERKMLIKINALGFSDYFFSTFIMGVSVLMIALNQPNFLENGRLAHFGKYSLGIYGLHVLTFFSVQLLTKKMAQEENWFLNPIFTIVTSVIIIWGIFRIKKLRKVAKIFL